MEDVGLSGLTVSGGVRGTRVVGFMVTASIRSKISQWKKEQGSGAWKSMNPAPAGYRGSQFQAVRGGRTKGKSAMI